MLQVQSSKDLNLWQTFHEIAEKSSKIVPLGAPPATCSFFFIYLQASIFSAHSSAEALSRKCNASHVETGQCEAVDGKTDEYRQRCSGA